MFAMTKKHWKIIFWKKKNFFLTKPFLGFLIHDPQFIWLTPRFPYKFLGNRSKDRQDKIKKEEESEKAKIIPGKLTFVLPIDFCRASFSLSSLSLLLPFTAGLSLHNRFIPNGRSVVWAWYTHKYIYTLAFLGHHRRAKHLPDFSLSTLVWKSIATMSHDPNFEEIGGRWQYQLEGMLCQCPSCWLEILPPRNDGWLWCPRLL